MSTSHRILKDILSLPTAPFAEHRIIEFVKSFCCERDLQVRSDQAGNLWARLRKGSRKIARPMCFTAHMDHPGFVADRMVETGRLRAHWRGGVRPGYFVGTRVRFAIDGRWAKGTITSIKTRKDRGRELVTSAEVAVKESIPPGSVGMWDLPDPSFKGKRVYARGCDCIAGVASLLCSIDALSRSRKPCEAYYLFTRAEEVGFVGAIAAARLKTIPQRCMIAAVETSSELPSARMGDGPILRVGDKSSIFTPAATAFCEHVAQTLARRDRSFRFQRKLMDGGTCESTAYCQFGYDATGICVALGNYHNMNVNTKKIASEYIHLDDFESMVRWFVTLAQVESGYDADNSPLTDRLRRLESKYAKRLRSTVEA